MTDSPAMIAHGASGKDAGMYRFSLLATLQTALAVRALARMRRAHAPRPLASRAAPSALANGARAHVGAGISAILPVLDEAERLDPALVGLSSQGPTLREILVIDGGSSDGTEAVVRRAALRDARIRFVQAPPPPPDWNGKAWQLACGLAEAGASADWILMTDADVRLRPGLIEAALHEMHERHADAATFAPRNVLADGLDGLLHPAFLATLVYRFGAPGTVARDPSDVLASGQCFIARRAQLEATDAIAGARDSRCEDVTIARTLAASGVPVLMGEAGRLAWVEMYASGAETWRNWPRSLPLRDRYRRPGTLAIDLASVALLQAAPPMVLALEAMRGRTRGPLFRTNLALTCMRLGILAGTARAYRRAPWTYWLSPGADLACFARLAKSAISPEVRWRGRRLVREGKNT